MEIDRNGLEVLDEEACRLLLGGRTLGRVGLTLNALPVILPVNYVLLDGDVVFRTGPGTKHAAALDGSVVCFEVDDADGWFHEGWSVLVTGRSEIIRDRATIERVAPPPPAWTGFAASEYVRIRTELISGRRISLATRAWNEGLLVAQRAAPPEPPPGLPVDPSS